MTIDFNRIEQLLMDEQYEHAFAILMQLDHPKADQWLAYIDSVAPDVRVRMMEGVIRRHRRQRTIYLVVMAVIAVALVIVAFLPQLQTAQMDTMFDSMQATLEADQPGVTFPEPAFEPMQDTIYRLNCVIYTACGLPLLVIFGSLALASHRRLQDAYADREQALWT